ncbi:MAG: putative dehydrogenase, partial [Candidatus Paceibacteria bacterium]
MTTKRLLVIGSGERVRKAALPVFERSEGFDIEGIISRTPKTIEADGKEYPVLGLDSLTRERLSGIDLIYMVVKKGAVPGLLATIAKLGPTHVDLLIETPVMLVRHLGHRKRLDCFRNVWVSEDCETLPCWDAVKGLLASGALGDLRSITLDRSAYAYHGMAMVKSILGGRAIRSAHQTTIQNGLRERRITVDNGLSALVVDPRDYSLGTLLFEGTSATLADFGAESDTRLRLEAQ